MCANSLVQPLKRAIFMPLVCAVGCRFNPVVAATRHAVFVKNRLFFA